MEPPLSYQLDFNYLVTDSLSQKQNIDFIITLCERERARATMGDAEYRKKEAEARALRSQKESKKSTRSHNSTTAKSSVANEIFDLPK
jgi:hypothetical protein